MTLDKSQYDKGLDSAESSANSFANRLGNGLKTLSQGAVGAIGVTAKIAAKGTIATANAIKDLTMQSFDAYSAQEQLIGGIQTLFGDSALEVIDNARIAYRTAGFSMNDYMETAIQSAASLISSLSGDQAEAAKLMDMTVIDMSDNVNKMGTTMEAVQNAYRGFSRGNFTMLDNLALGFSGTKEGMQELLDKAKEFTGIEYDINSYADIVKAVHEVQTAMGITDTTKLEAEGTISGSIGSLKAAWQNLVAGLADEDADLGVLFSNVFNSAATVIKNAIPTINRILQSLTDNIGVWISSIISHFEHLSVTEVYNASQIIINLINSLIKAVATYTPMLTEIGNRIIQGIFFALSSGLDFTTLEVAVKNIFVGLSEVIAWNASDLFYIGQELFLSLINGFSEALPEVVPNITQAILIIARIIAANVDKYVEAGLNLLVGLAEGFAEALPIVAEDLPYIIETIVTELTKPEMIIKITSASIKIITALAKGLLDFVVVLLNTAPELIDSLVKAFEENWPQIKAAGHAMLITLATAFVNKLPELTNVGYKAISSLSKLLLSLASGFGEIGRAIINGIIAGINARWSALTNVMTRLAKSALSAAKSVLGIHSPSTVFENQVGEPIAEGIELGFEKSMPLELKKMQSILSSSIPEFSAVNNVTNTRTIGSTGEIVLMIDDHELARFLAPSINSQLAFGRA